MASKGISTASKSKGMPYGFAETIPFDKVPLVLFHATATKNLKSILENGIRLGREEGRSLEYEWDEFRKVQNRIFFTESIGNANYFGMQSAQSICKRENRECKKEDLDYVVFKMNMAYMPKDTDYFKGAELFETGEHEIYVMQEVARENISEFQRHYYDSEKNEYVTKTYHIKWKSFGKNERDYPDAFMQTDDYAVIEIDERWF